LYALGQFLIWYNKPDAPGEKIDCFQNFLQAGYLHLIFGVVVLPRLSQLTLIRSRRTALAALIQLSCVVISIFPFFQAMFVKDSAFHLKMTFGSSIYVVSHFAYFAKQRYNPNGVQNHRQMQVQNHQNMNNASRRK
jgi:hypothetical protein